MTDVYDRAQARDAQMLADALAAQQRRAGLAGKSAADSAEICQAADCGEPIPATRRAAVPGCRYCVACQARNEKLNKGASR